MRLRIQLKIKNVFLMIFQRVYLSSNLFGAQGDNVCKWMHANIRVYDLHYVAGTIA